MCCSWTKPGRCRWRMRSRCQARPRVSCCSAIRSSSISRAREVIPTASAFPPSNTSLAGRGRCRRIAACFSARPGDCPRRSAPSRRRCSTTASSNPSRGSNGNGWRAPARSMARACGGCQSITTAIRTTRSRKLTRSPDWSSNSSRPARRGSTRDGLVRQLTGGDLRIVSPFNAQVNRIAERVAAFDVPVGTVDKFQGQEAPIVIYSMATSRPEDAPRGMEFLYSLNRFNVATSRARCAVVVVASPRLLEPVCRTPEQMKLANALCRYVELARRMRCAEGAMRCQGARGARVLGCQGALVPQCDAPSALIGDLGSSTRVPSTLAREHRWHPGTLALWHPVTAPAYAGA